MTTEPVSTPPAVDSQPGPEPSSGPTREEPGRPTSPGSALESADGEKPPTFALESSEDGSVQRTEVLARLESGRTEIANKIDNYDNCTFVAPSNRVEELGREHFILHAPAQLAELRQSCVSDPSELDEICADLARHRFLLLVGQQNVGKGTLALLALSEFRARRCGDLSVGECHALAPEIRVPLRRAGVLEARLRNGLWVLRDVLSSGHQELQLFLEELEPISLATLTRRLADENCYLVLTTEVRRIASSLPKLETLGVIHRTQGPPAALLRVVLERKALELVQRRRVNDALRQQVEALLSQSGDQICERLATPARIALFVERQLLAVAQGEEVLGDSLEQVESRASWLLRDLASELDTLSFALALVLAQPYPPYTGASWLTVHALASEIHRVLRRLTRDTAGSTPLVVDERRLESLGAEVRRSTFLGADLVRFREESTAEELWRVLLSTGRELLGSLLPLLESLAHEDDARHAALPFVAARALGRCGEVDVRSVVLPLLGRWAGSSLPVHHLCLGQLLQSALASSVPDYRESCLVKLRQLILQARGDRAWAVAVALREVGGADLEVALNGLLLLAEGQLDEAGLKLSTSRREELRQAEEQLRQLALRRQARGQPGSDPQEQLRRLLVPALCGQDRSAISGLAAVRYAIVGLCFACGSREVLASLAAKLVARSEDRLSGLLSALCLGYDGILDVLERNPLVTKSEASLLESEGSVVSRFLVGAVEIRNGAQELSDLLEQLYADVEALPGGFVRCLRARLVAMIRTWCTQAATEPLFQATLQSVLSELLQSERQGLKAEIFGLLQLDPDFQELGSPLRKLAQESLALALT